jgi:hypothetical protein
MIESDPNAEPFYISHGAMRRGHRQVVLHGQSCPALAHPDTRQLIARGTVRASSSVVRSVQTAARTHGPHSANAYL